MFACGEAYLEGLRTVARTWKPDNCQYVKDVCVWKLGLTMLRKFESQKVANAPWRAAALISCAVDK
jgi:hypothetical protein